MPKEKIKKGEVTRLAIEDAAISLFMEQGYHATSMRQIADKEPALLKAYMAWLLKSARGYGIKIVNPGG